MAVDHVLRMLMEMQLIKIVGRSELPGRPMLYGTTTLFLEHFGLKNVKELPGITELARMDAMRKPPEHSVEASQIEPVDGEDVAGQEPSVPNKADQSDPPDLSDLPGDDSKDEFEDEADDDEDEDEEE